jgi:hypothetical protein
MRILLRLKISGHVKFLSIYRFFGKKCRKLFNFMKKIISFALPLILVASFAIVPSVTVASGGTVVVDTINGQPASGTCVAGAVTIAGHGTTGSNGGQYSIDIGWGDGSATTTLSNIAQGAGTNFTFSAGPHSPLKVSTSITVYLYHGSPGGADSNLTVTTFCAAPATSAVLTIKKNVINDNGGSAVASNFTLHLKNATSSTEVISNGNGVVSPFSGSSVGTDFIIPPAGFNISENSYSGYTMTGIGGFSCPLTATSTGTVTVAAGKNYVCTVTNNDDAPAPTATSLSVSAVSATYGDTVSLSATLSPAVSGKSIDFSVNGVSKGSATTNGSGLATLAGVSLSGVNVGTYPAGVSASFAGDSGYSAFASILLKDRVSLS